MATHSVQPGAAPANPGVSAYLAAHADELRFDQADDGGSDTLESRMAQFAARGGRDYVMAWGITDAEHGALAALLAAERLEYLIDGYSLRNERGDRQLTFGAEETYEVYQIKHTLLNLWRHLDPAGRQFQPFARQLGLVDDNGNQIG